MTEEHGKAQIGARAEASATMLRRLVTARPR